MTTITTTTAAAIRVRLLPDDEVVELEVLDELELLTGGVEVLEVVETDDVGEDALDVVETDDDCDVLLEVVDEIPCARLSPKN